MRGGPDTLRAAILQESQSGLQQSAGTTGRDLSARRQAIDQPRQMLRDLAQQLAKRQPGSLGHLLYQVRPQRVWQGVRRDRLIGAGADPGLYHAPQASRFKALHDAAQATFMVGQHIDQQFRHGAGGTTAAAQQGPE